MGVPVLVRYAGYYLYEEKSKCRSSKHDIIQTRVQFYMNNILWK